MSKDLVGVHLEDVVVRDGNLLQRDGRASACRIDCEFGPTRDAVAGGIDPRESQAAFLAKGDDQPVGGRPAPHHAFLARDRAVLALATRSIEGPGPVGFYVGDRGQLVSAREGGQPGRALCLGSSELDRQPRQRRGQERGGQQASPRFFQQHREVSDAQTGAAAGFGQYEAHPTELAKLPPARGIVPALVLQQAAHFRDRRPLGQPAASFLSQQIVFFFVADVRHRDFGSPRTFSPSTLRRISLVPPAIVVAYEFM